MNSFSISELEHYSGIKTHTIRAWEKRYNALRPARSEGNTRYYTGEQLRRLLNIVSLLQSGHKLPELSRMKDEKLFQLLQQNLASPGNPDRVFCQQLVAAALGFQEARFDRIFSHCITHMGLKEAYLRVLYPTLELLGMLWASNQVAPANEHFISNLIRQKLFTAIDGLPVNESSKNRWLLFLPENEFHEIGLLFANYLIREAGHQVCYLGANLAPALLQQAIEETKPTALLYFVVSKRDAEERSRYGKKLALAQPKTEVYVAAHPSQTEGFGSAKNLHFLKSVRELETLLKK